MGTIGTFGGFTTARLGIYAAQRALDVTGHNITNINTAGYTRQRLDQMSLRVGGGDRYVSQYNLNIGNGVLCTGVSQLRDPYLDIRYRNERSTVGSLDAKLSGLDDLTRLLDEVAKNEGDGVLEKQLKDIRSQLQNLKVNPGSFENETIVRDAAKQLTSLFNDYATKLAGIKQDHEMNLKQDVDKVNGLLKDIANLNDNIMKSEIHGDPALELRDQRNLKIDELSQFMKIDVTYVPISMGAGTTVESMVISLAGTEKGGPNSRAELVNGAYASEVSIRDFYTKNPNYDPNDPTAQPFLDANGNPTGDPALAAKYPKPNPLYNAADTTTMPYLDALGNPTADPTLAEQVPQPNAKYDPTNPAGYKYLDVDGKPTNDPTAAEKIPNPNPAYDSKNPVGYQYIKSNGKFTNDPTAAKQVPKPNPNYDPNVPGSLPYEKPDGTFTSNPNEAAQVPQKNAKYDPADPAGHLYVKADGTTTNDPTAAEPVPKPNPAYDPKNPAGYLYRDANGKPTNDPALANQVPNANPNYDPKNPAGYKYLTENNQLTNDISKAPQLVKTNPAFDPTNPKAPFLDKAGNPTGDISLAKKYYSPNYELDLGPLTDNSGRILAGSTAKPLGDLDLYGSLQATREMLTESGEYSTNAAVGMDGAATTKRGIPYYQNALDALARKFAETFNSANEGFCEDTTGNYVGADGKPLEFTNPDGSKTILTTKTVLTADQEAFLTANGVPMEGGGPLFSNNSDGNDTTGITAANISISKDWSIAKVRIVNSKVMGYNEDGTPTPGKANSGANDNIVHMMTLFDSKQKYTPDDIKDLIGDPYEGNNVYFEGTFQQMLSKIDSTLAVDTAATSALLNNYAASMNEIDSGRSSVSGVDLNDEAANMMQYQKSYSAACRLMTTMDEALEKLINGTGVVGR